MTRRRCLLGAQGEELAAVFLKKKGHRVVNRHFRSPWGEIDIISRKGRALFFIEVKTRTSRDFGDPLEAVFFVKKKRLYRTALWYMNGRDEDVHVRFSVIGIVIPPGGEPVIEMIDDAFEPDADR